MTVSTATASASYTGNGTTQIFPVPFYFLVDTDLKVSQKSAATGDIEVLTLNSDFTVSGEGDQAGGSITVLTAPPSGDELFIERNVSAVQETAYPENGIFPAASHEQALDRLTMIAQQIITALGFKLGRGPLDTAYDVGGNRLANVADGEDATDVATVSQVDAKVAAAAGGVLPDSIALLPNLASSDDGKGAALVGYLGSTVRAFLDKLNIAGATTGAALLKFLAPGTGAIGRPAQAKLADVVNVLDYGAVGDGVTDDGPAFQYAVNALGTGGGIVLVPPLIYAWATPVTAHAGVLLKSEMLSDIAASTNGGDLGNIRPLIKWTGAASDTGVMYTVSPSVVGNHVRGGGAAGISWTGNKLIGYGVRLDNTKDAEFSGRVTQFTHVGVDICSISGSTSNFSMHNRVPYIDIVYGATAETENMTGLLLRGNGSTIPATQQFVGKVTGLVKNGFGVTIQETDNSKIEYVAVTRDSGGTGGSLKLLNVGAQTTYSNVFTYVVGSVQMDNGVFGNHFLNLNGEGSSLTQLAGVSSWHGNLIDYVGGKKYESHAYQLRKKIGIPAGAFITDGASGQLQLASQWIACKLPDAVTSSITATLAPDYDIDSGQITGIEVRVSTNGTSGGNYSFQVLMSALSDTNKSSVVTPELSQTFTVSAPAQYTMASYTLTFTTPLSVASGDNLFLRIVRNGAADTNTDDCIVVSARLLFAGDGPTAGGSGPWFIPNW